MVTAVQMVQDREQTLVRVAALQTADPERREVAVQEMVLLVAVPAAVVLVQVLEQAQALAQLAPVHLAVEHLVVALRAVEHPATVAAVV